MASSTEAEGHATAKAADIAEEAAEIKRAMGVPIEGPVVIGTDSVTNGYIANRQGAANRMKHALRRWETLVERIDAGLVKLVHLPDPQMPADFLTKWVTAKKVNETVDYLTNVANKVPHPMAP